MSFAATPPECPAAGKRREDASSFPRLILRFSVVLTACTMALTACARQARDTPNRDTKPRAAGMTQSSETLMSRANGETPAAPAPPRKLPETLKLDVVASHPHDAEAFTQGLVFRNGFLYESTGLYGRSTLRQVEIATGKVARKIDIPRDFFAEGIEIVGQYVFLLTWQEKRCFVFDRDTFRHVATFPYEGEGWGICYDGKSLVLSDGSATLRFYDPKNFKQTGKLTVFDGKNARTGRPVTALNELEYVHGEIWANVWKETRIVRIDPATGRVIGWIDLTSLVPEAFREEVAWRKMKQYGDNVLNGIAFDPAKDRFYVTGKNWPVLYEIAILPDAEGPPRP